jgi:hypothetical protein
MKHCLSVMIWFLICTFGCTTSFSVNAQEATNATSGTAKNDSSVAVSSGGPAITVATESDPLRVELLSPAGVPAQYFIDETLVLRVTALNKVEIRSARVMPIGRTGRLYMGDDSCRISGAENEAGADSLRPLQKGEQVLVACSMPADRSFWGNTFSLLSSSHSSEAMIEVEVPGGKHASYWIAKRVTFTASPLFVSPLLGGVVGALVLAMLAWALNAKRSRAGFIKTLLLGPLIAFVLIVGTSLFSSGTSASILPISVSVADFQGGFLIGLLAYLLRDPIAKRLGISLESDLPPSTVPVTTDKAQD